ncbi:competence/damage-inducible protein A [Hydromonas duriensis]|uniref:Molybdopterin-biosynthesis enzyme MoeA-like protein n=1 Tax=Hydromonas duriensis TaxID=1527608 RepID=A0A4R6YBC0_9BURK|nr:molybdopterin-binding protein [Hydromonas duriensis]TDR32815.1 molybdopterin-biosynthesis enzyme MoeA-like protein [Hydromonas duriensis]
MRFGLMIIGDEILNGSRTDAHFQAIRAMLDARGLRLAWVEYVADEPTEIVARLQRSFAQDVPVFVTGGIGATPDDHTRQAAASALGVPLLEHPVAAKFIEELSVKRGDDLNGAIHLQRLQMAHFPQGAEIIPNPFNNVAGFSIQRHYFVPGFPVMAHPMLEWVLETYYKHEFFKQRHAHLSAHLYGLQESQIAPFMIAIERDFAGVKTYSLPKIVQAQEGEASARRYHIELGVKATGDACVLLEEAWQVLKQKVLEIGGEIV